MRFQCAGCAIINNFPKDCYDNCPVLLGKGNKHTPLLVNYSLIMSYRNNKNDFKNKKK